MGLTHPRCAVIGAANIDIGGFPERDAVPGDSNPGRVTLSAGGVGRNIACNLARLGVETHLVAALGEDDFAAMIRADSARAGVRLDLAFSFADAPSSAYLFIADARGDMALAVNDMAVCGRLTPDALSTRLDALNAMDAVLIDANLSTQALAWIASNVKPPLIADAVSAAKARRLRPALGRLWAIKPNALEAEALTGIPVTDMESASRAARALVDAGVRRACVTLGERGACCADADRTLTLPGRPLKMVSATGAGDAFTAALAWAALRGLDLRESAMAGLAAASIAVESLETVNPAMSEAALRARMAALQDGAVPEAGQ